jgi:hypothetical protein
VITTWPIVTEGTGAPRALHVHFPMGNAVGEPGKPVQQRRILLSALEVMEQIAQPGTLVELPYRWRRMKLDT